jgi:hypothetical protein
MRLRDALNTYMTGVILIACGVTLWALGRGWWWAVLLAALGGSSIAGRLLLRRRWRHALAERSAREG